MYLARTLLAFTLCQSAIAAESPVSKSKALPDPLAARWQGSPVCERIHEDQSQRILRCTFPPGVGHEPHFHISHFGYAISGGKMRITEKQTVREVVLSTGSSYYSEGVEQHEVLNIGSTDVVYLIMENKTPGASSTDSKLIE